MAVKRIKTFIKRFLQKIRRLGYTVPYKFFCITEKQNPYKIAMLSASRAEISGNLKFIYDALGDSEYEIELYLKKSLNAKKTWKEKLHLSKLVAQSKFVLLDDFFPIIYAFKLRKGTELIQVWHAMGAFKTVGYSRMGKVGGPSAKSLTHRNYTAAIVSSDKIRKNYAEAFGINIEKIHATGIPRTDVFFDERYIKNTEEMLYKKYPQLKKKKVILFAPTFRGKGQKTAYYDFSWIDFEKIKREFKDEYMCIIKLHPFIKNNEQVPNDDEFFLNLSHEREINDLLFITDILITDYSSVIFEYSLLEKRAIFYVPDLEEYIETRDFYYPFENYTYGNVTKNMAELIAAIKNPKLDVKKIRKFKDYFCSACDGKATKRFLDTLILSKEGKDE